MVNFLRDIDIVTSFQQTPSGCSFDVYFLWGTSSEGWVPIKGGRNDGDRFKISWQVGNEVIVGEYNDGESTVTEHLKKAKK